MARNAKQHSTGATTSTELGWRVRRAALMAGGSQLLTAATGRTRGGRTVDTMQPMMALALLMVVAVLVAGLWALMHLAGAPVALDTSQRTVPATGPITFDLYRVGSRNTYDNQRQRTPSTLTVHNGRISVVHPDGHVWLNKPVGRVRVTIGATGYVTLGPFLAVSEFPPEPSRASFGPELDLARRITLALQGLIPVESPGAAA